MSTWVKGTGLSLIVCGVAALASASCSHESAAKHGLSKPSESTFSNYSIKVFAGPKPQLLEVHAPPHQQAAGSVPSIAELVDKTKAMLKRSGAVLDRPQSKEARARDAELDEHFAAAGLVGSSSADASTEGQGSSKGAPGGRNQNSNPAPPGVTPQIDVKSGATGDSVDLDIKKFGDDNTGGALVFGAAFQCGMGSNPDPTDSWYYTNSAYIPEVQTPVLTGNAFPDFGESIFAAAPGTCEVALHQQQLLVCIAGELSKIANAVGPVVWDKIPVFPFLDGLPGGPWVIPPAQEEDRFIARDQALLMLAHAAELEVDNIWHLAFSNLPATALSCDQLAGYALTASESEYNNLTAVLFSANILDSAHTTMPLIPPFLPPTYANRTELIKARMKLRAQIRRAAGRLLRDELISKSVYADLAGAYQQRNHATDPRSGLELMWGVSDQNSDIFNSLRHVSRVLGGYWRQDPAAGSGLLNPDPDQLLLAYGVTLPARVADIGVSSPGAEIASRVLENAGILLPADVNLASARSAVLDQLTAASARANGIQVPSDEYTAFKDASSIPQTLAKVTDPDLQFAIQRALLAYKQLASKSDLDTSDLGFGFAASPNISSSISALGGTVLSGALPRSQLAGDITARAAGLIPSGRGTPGFAGNDLYDLLQAGGGYYWAREDAFAMGEVFMRGLQSERAEMLAANFASDDEAVVSAAAGAAEIRSWAGPGKVIIRQVTEDDNLEVVLAGFDWKDLGLSGASDISAGLGVVYGTAAVADCAAGLRKACPDDFAAQYVAHPATANVITDPVLLRAAGEATPIISFVLTPGTPSKFVLPTTPNPSSVNGIGVYGNPEEYVHVIARSSPQASGVGRVLASFPMRRGNPFAVVVSDHRRELINAAFGVADDIGTQGSKVGGESTAMPKGYCVPGVAKNAFVPLENELTDNGDQFENSWRHYIERAKDTAARSDEIANQILSLKLADANHREAAQEKLGEVCGAYGDLKDINFDNGKSTCSGDASDSALCQCLSEPKWDLVFFSDDPTSQICGKDVLDTTHETETDCLKRRVLKCNDHHQPLCDKTEPFEHTGLNLVKFQEDPPDLPTSCQSIGNMMDTLQNGGMTANQLATLGDDKWREPGPVKALVANTRFKLELDGTWNVTVSGSKIMDSRDNATLWPGCMQHNPTPCDPQSATAPATIKFYDQIFRSKQARASANSEDMQVMWSVEGALWVLAGLAESAPAGYFELPVPAVDYALPLADSSSYPAPAAAVYGSGSFHPNGDTGPNMAIEYVLDTSSGADGSVTTDDTAALAVATDDADKPIRAVSPDGFHYEDVTPAQPWLADVYEHGPDRAHYLHVMAPTAARTISDPDRFISGGKNWEKFFQEVGTGLNGTKCDSAAGFRATDQFGDQKTLRRIANLKFPQQDFRVCSGLATSAKITYTGSDFSPSPTTTLMDHYTITNGIFGCGGSRGGPPNPDCGLVKLLGSPGEPTFPVGGVAIDAWKGPTAHVSCSGLATLIRPECAKNSGTVTSSGGGKNAISVTGVANMTRNRLRPTACKPQDRAHMLTNVYPPSGGCDAAAQMAQAMGLACMIGENAALPANSLLEPPQMTGVGDAAAMGRWVRSIRAAAKGAVRGFYIDSVPKRALGSVAGQASDSLRGTKGQDITAIGSKISEINDDWSLITERLDVLAGNYDGLQIQLDLIKLEEDQKQKALEIDKLNAHKELVDDAAKAIQSLVGGGGPSVSFLSPTSLIAFGNPLTLTVGGAVGVANGITQVSFDMDKLSLISDEVLTENEIKDKRLQGAINEFNTTARTEFGTLERGINGVGTAARQTLGDLGALASDEEQAQYEVAQAMGAPYFTNSDGEKVVLPVNETLAEQFDIYRKRFEKTANEARYLAYFARLAIEQRIGMRLSEIQTSIGNLEAPSIWADDICFLKGVDYKQIDRFNLDAIDDEDLSSFTPTQDYKDGVGKAAADAAKGDRSLLFIGDYVNQLENFVSFYNIQYPSKDAEDVAVLSLREDLATASAPVCIGKARNLLRFSGDLTASLTDDTTGEITGWQTARCNGSMLCLELAQGGAVRASSADVVPAGLKGPIQTTSSSVTWLHDVQYDNTVVGAGGAPGAGGTPGAGGAGEAVEQAQPLAVTPRSVYQRVTLPVGSYVLSWWDRAITADGIVSSTPTGSYRASVIDANGTAQVAYSGDAVTGDWSPRRSVSFTVTEPGDYYVVFGASISDAAGSVALASVQLETAGSIASSATEYVHTEADLTQTTNTCTPANSFKSAFDHVCDAGRCWYELRTPFVIDTLQLESGFSPLANKIATGNFNFRHVDTALNVVGTGVIDCSKVASTDCYANSYLEYSLEHIGYDLTLFDHNNQPHEFNFGLGAIRNAKAPAAERVITQPIATADGELLHQPQFTKTELGGRPLSGVYRFRIYDKPELNWDAIEDVQFVLRHRYWSRVQKNPSP